MTDNRISDERRDTAGRRTQDRRLQAVSVDFERRMSGNRRTSLDRRMYLDRRTAATSIMDIM